MALQMKKCTGYPSNTIGYADGATLENDINDQLRALQKKGYKIVGTKIINTCEAWITYNDDKPTT